MTFVEKPVIGLEMEKKTRKELEGVRLLVQDKKDYAKEAKIALNEKLQQIEEQEDIVAEERDGFEEEEAVARKLRRKIQVRHRIKGVFSFLHHGPANLFLSLCLSLTRTFSADILGSRPPASRTKMERIYSRTQQ